MNGVDYAFYTDAFLGAAIPPEAFDRCALRAAEQLDADTFGRAALAAEGADETADAVRRCCCALAELCWARERGQDAAVQREALGSWSRTYARGTSDSPAAQRRGIEERYLARSGLLYRGRDSRV